MDPSFSVSIATLTAVAVAVNVQVIAVFEEAANKMHVLSGCEL